MKVINCNHPNFAQTLQVKHLKKFHKLNWFCMLCKKSLKIGEIDSKYNGRSKMFAKKRNEFVRSCKKT